MRKVFGVQQTLANSATFQILAGFFLRNEKKLQTGTFEIYLIYDMGKEKGNILMPS